MMENHSPAASLTRKDYENYFRSGLTYSEFMKNLEVDVEAGTESKYAKHLPVNLARSRRVMKTLTLTDEIQQALSALHHRVRWLVISEGWCGDSSQTLPVIAAVAEAASGNIDLRIALRDSNPGLMDAHLTQGTRSIPKLIQLDENYRVTGLWGPRPNEAQRRVKEWKANEETAKSYSELLHKWYADDKTLSTQKELLQLLRMAIALCPDCLGR